MKKLLILLLVTICLSSCVYNVVDENTSISKKAVDFSYSLKDSAKGLYIFKDNSNGKDYVFSKDSTGVRLKEKYLGEDAIQIRFGPLGCFILVLGCMLLGGALTKSN